MSGLTFWKNSNNDNILLDADNIFWAVMMRDRESSPFISRELLSLYEKSKEKLDAELKGFRFSKELTAIYIDPTDRCNANCLYCYIPKEIRRNGSQMDRGQLLYVLNKIARYFERRKKKPVIVFHASEPLLVKEIIFEGIKTFGKRFSFGIQTNSVLLKEEDVEFLKRYRVGVGISLDSYEPKVNNFLRPSFGSRDNFNNAVRAIEWFDGYDGLNVITTITKFNVSQLPDLIKFLHSKKVGCVLLNPVRLTQGPSRKFKPNEKLLTKYFIKAVDVAIELSRRSNRRIIVGNFANIILGIVAPTARRLMCDISPCGGGRCFLTITASGDMLPCGEFIGLRGFSGGNIFKTSITQAMRSTPFKKIRARITERIEGCSSCIFRNICGAPCPAELHSLGNMNSKAIFCEFYKEVIKYAFKLIAEGKESYFFREESLKNLKYEYNLYRRL